MLEENYMVETWIKSVRKVENPFGDGKAAKRIVDVIQARFANTATTAAAKV
jgi:UDP-N-acetylglucosamine 2-epimerase